MRSADAPSMSRRSMMRSLAIALAGASVPVAAIAGATARKLVGDDTELLNRCRDWHDQWRRLKRTGKELARLYDEAWDNMPPKPRELFEPIEQSANLPLYDLSKLKDTMDGSWPRERLVQRIERPFNPVTTPFVGPTPECKAHCRKLALLDEYEATEERLFAPYRRLERIDQRECLKHGRLFLRIIRTKAETLQGVAAQFEVLERYWYP